MKQMKSSDNAKPSGPEFAAEGIYIGGTPPENRIEEIPLIVADKPVPGASDDGLVTIKVPRELGTAINAAIQRGRYFATVSYLRADRQIGTHCTTNGFPHDGFDGALERIKDFAAREATKAPGAVTTTQAAQAMRQSLKDRRQRGAQRRQSRGGRKP